VLTIADLPYDHVILCDTEYHFGVDSDGNPREADPLQPVCVCALDLKSGKTWKQWLGGFSAKPPFPTDDRTLFVAYAAAAEMRTFRALGWPAPRRILDLFAEFVTTAMAATAPRAADCSTPCHILGSILSALSTKRT